MRLFRFVPLVLLLAGGCAPLRPPMGGQAEPPSLANGVFVTRDGTRLPMREWDAADKDHPHALILALHGMSDYSHAFAMPGRFWASQGITTLAYDQRGFGAGPNPGLWAGADVMRRDLSDFVAAAKARFPGVPVFILGESMGGAVVLTALASDSPPPVDGAILVAPAVWSRADMPVSYRVALFLTAHLFPGLILSNSAASHVVTVIASDNIEMLRALGRDPLFQKKTRADALFGLVNLMDAARGAPKTLKDPPPILFLYGAHDQLIPAASTKAVLAGLEKAAPGALAVHRYPNGYHMLLRDLDGCTVQRDVGDWVLDHAKQGGNKSAPCPLPSVGNSGRATMEQKKHDLRDELGKVRGDANTNAKLAGHTDKMMPIEDSGAHPVSPGADSQGGVAEGQGTKSS